MPNVKIFLDKDETPEQAEDLLFKAMESQRNGDIHQDEFSDPAMRDLLDRMQKIYKDSYDELLQEIMEALDKEYNKNGHF
jgi:hypothetical protein